MRYNYSVKVIAGIVVLLLVIAANILYPIVKERSQNIVANEAVIVAEGSDDSLDEAIEITFGTSTDSQSISPSSVKPSSTPVPTKAPAPTPVPTQAQPTDLLWTGITEIYGGYNYVVGLRKDGTVALQQYEVEYYDEVPDVAGWKDIIQLDAAGSTVVGLHSNGRVESTGSYFDDEVQAWKDIKEIRTSGAHTLALKKNGTVVFAGYAEPETYDALSAWINVDRIKAEVCSAGVVSLGLTADGHYPGNGRQYEDIFSSGWLTVAVKKDGSVDTWGIDADQFGGQVLMWRNVKEVCPGDTKAIALFRDGTIAFAGPEVNFTQIQEAETWTGIEHIFLFEGQPDPDGEWFNVLAGIDQAGKVHIASSSWTFDTSSWTDIVDIVMSSGNLIGRSSQGYVYVAQPIAKTYTYQHNASLPTNPNIFQNGTLTFMHGATMLVPANFSYVGSEQEEDVYAQTYRFNDANLQMSLVATEGNVWSYSFVGQTSDGRKTWWYADDADEFISEMYKELQSNYPGATYQKQGDNYCVISGYQGSNIYYIKYRAYGDVIYSFSCLYPSANASRCNTIVETIEDNFVRW